jgi:hypothetical protein
VTEKELDNLLGQAFLNLDFNNPKNQELMETISNHVLPASPVSSGLINKAFFHQIDECIIAIIATSVFIYIILFLLIPSNQTSRKKHNILQLSYFFKSRRNNRRFENKNQ